MAKHFTVFRITVLILLILGLHYSIFRNSSQHPSPVKLKTLSHCYVPEWNKVETSSTSSSTWNSMSRWLWMALDLSRENNQNYTCLNMIGAYVYPDHISITLSSQYMVKQQLFCRYYDCKKEEIPESAWQGVVFPESVIHCPRRIGAEFVSVSKERKGGVANPMRLKFRNFEKPVHDLSICVAPLYGNEPKWLQIAEFIEYHKLQGVTFFYFHIGNISNYDRKVLDEYENNGDIEVKVLQEKYERPFYAWQMLEIQDCHMRAKYHSKWTTFIDIDERLHVPNGRVIDLLNSHDNPRLGEINMPILNIIKNEDVPEKYESEEQVKQEIISLKWNSAAEPTWNASKALIKPDKVGIMSIHYAVAMEPGFASMKLEASQIALRHYRSTHNRENLNNWFENETMSEQPLPSEFSTRLSRNVVEKVKSIYEKVPVKCSTIPKYMWESRQFPDPCERMLLTW